MKGVERGMRVTFTASLDDAGKASGGGVGLVLDRAPDNGTWWVMPSGASRALLVHRDHMERRNRP